MRGMNLHTGRSVGGLQHLYQSIGKILTTPTNSRLVRRDFGIELESLVDAPNNAATRVRVFAAVATALMRWEPRLQLTRLSIAVDDLAPGALIIEIEGTTTVAGAQVSTKVNMGRQA